MTRRAATPKPRTRKTRGGYPAGGRTVGELPAPPPSVTVHPGVLAAHDGPVTEAECGHPASRRDPKNPGRCCACTAVGLPAPAKGKSAGRR